MRSSSAKRHPGLGLALSLLSALLFGLNAASSKVVMAHGFEPSQMVLMRSFFTAALAFAFVAVQNPKNLRFTGREPSWLALFGVVGVGLMQWSYSNAVKLLPVGVALLIEYTCAAMVPLASWLLFKQRIHRRIWLAVVLILVGLAVVAQLGSAALNPTGILFGFMAAIFLSSYFLVGERIQRTRDTMSTLAYSMLFAGLLWLVLGAGNGLDLGKAQDTVSLTGNFNSIQVPLWSLMLFIGVMGTFVPMWLSYRALYHLSPTTAGITATAETIFAFAFGWLWLGENIGGLEALGALLVIGGILIAQTSRIGE